MSAPKQQVWIRLIVQVNDLFLQPPNEHHQLVYPLRVTYDRSRRVTVEVEPASADAPDRAGIATGTGECAASGTIAEMLRDITEGRVPVGTQPRPPSELFLDKEPLFDPDTRLMRPDLHAPPLALLPDRLQSFLNQATSEVNDYVVRTVRVMRWRKGAEGPHNPFIGVKDGRHFSLDGVTWHRLPATGSMTTWGRGSLRLSDAEWSEVTDMVAGGVDEPFSSELYREALSHRTGNFRSALLLGIASVEVGFKECVATLVPDAAWLVQEAPTPPLVTMLTEYLPRLPAKNLIAGKVVPPPKEHLERLKKGIFKRNRLAHSGKVDLTGNEIKALLETIEEILWLLGYYCGAGWQLEHLSIETRQALGVPLSAWEEEAMRQRRSL